MLAEYAAPISEAAYSYSLMLKLDAMNCCNKLLLNLFYLYGTDLELRNFGNGIKGRIG